MKQTCMQSSKLIVPCTMMGSKSLVSGDTCPVKVMPLKKKIKVVIFFPFWDFEKFPVHDKFHIIRAHEPIKNKKQ